MMIRRLPRPALRFQRLPRAATIRPFSSATPELWPVRAWAQAGVPLPVHPSLLEVAGNGRFVVADEEVLAEREVVVRKGEPVVQKPIYTMKEMGDKPAPANVTLTFEDEADLELYIRVAQERGGYSREQVLYVYEHFMYGFDGATGCLNVSAWTISHADEASQRPFDLNVLVVKREELLDGEDKKRTVYAGVATRDIYDGEELHMDYRRFRIPEFFLDFCAKNGIGNARTATLNAVYGGDGIEQCGEPERCDTGFGRHLRLGQVSAPAWRKKVKAYRASKTWCGHDCCCARTARSRLGVPPEPTRRSHRGVLPEPLG